MTASSGSGVVLVTGAAGAIGSATMTAFDAIGYTVVGFDRVGAGTSHTHVVVDVTDERALTAAVSEVESLGPLTHVVGVAGEALPGEPDAAHDPTSLDPLLFRKSLETNLTSQFLVLRAVYPWLRQTPPTDCSVAFTSSFNGFSAQGMPAYSAAKAGLAGLMHACVDPLGRDGIRINVVVPGTISTPRTEALWSGKAGHFERLERGTALGRLGRPEDVAAAFVALAGLRHVTGQMLFVDGGQTAVHR